MNNMNKKLTDLQFTPIPTKLMRALHVNCRSMFFVLCQLHTYFGDEEGVFFRTNADLVEETEMSEKLVRATLDTLFQHGLVQIWSVGKSQGKHSNRFKLNFNKIEEYEKYSFDELKNPELKIKTVKDYNKKGYSPTYLKIEEDVVSQEGSQESPTIIPKVSLSTNNIYIIDNINNEENKDIIENVNNENNKENTNNRKFEINVDIEKYKEETVEERLKKYFQNDWGNAKLFTYLAKNDWECYVHLKNNLKTNEDEIAKQTYKRLVPLFHKLNFEYNPN